MAKVLNLQRKVNKRQQNGIKDQENANPPCRTLVGREMGGHAGRTTMCLISPSLLNSWMVAMALMW